MLAGTNYPSCLYLRSPRINLSAKRPGTDGRSPGGFIPLPGPCAARIPSPRGEPLPTSCLSPGTFLTSFLAPAAARLRSRPQEAGREAADKEALRLPDKAARQLRGARPLPLARAGPGKRAEGDLCR